MHKKAGTGRLFVANPIGAASIIFLFTLCFTHVYSLFCAGLWFRLGFGDLLFWRLFSFGFGVGFGFGFANIV